MNDKPLDTLGITQGRNPSTRAGSIGGVDTYIDDDGHAVLILGIGENDDPVGRRVELHEGETFGLGPELWKVTAIDHPDTDIWGAELTRIR